MCVLTLASSRDSIQTAPSKAAAHFLADLRRRTRAVRNPQFHKAPIGLRLRIVRIAETGFVREARARRR
jgi:hypothetical protein